MIEQIVNRGHESIVEIEDKLSATLEQMNDAQRELATLPEQRVSTDKAREAVEQAEDEYNQAVAYAKLARDTVNQQDAIKAVSLAKKSLASAKKNLSTIEREAQETEQRILTREAELTALLVELNASKEQLDTELKHTRSAHKQAHMQLGSQKYEAILQKLAEYQEIVDKLEAQLIEAQTNYYDFHQSALQELAEWPDLQREIATPVDDSTSRMIEATMAYIEAIMQNMEYVRDFPGIPWALWDTLIIPTQIIRGYPGALEDRYSRLEQVLKAYRNR